MGLRPGRVAFGARLILTGISTAMEERRLGKIGGRWVRLPVAPRFTEPTRIATMRRTFWSMALLGVLAMGGMVGLGGTPAQAPGYGYRGYGGAYSRGYGRG